MLSEDPSHAKAEIWNPGCVFQVFQKEAAGIEFCKEEDGTLFGIFNASGLKHALTFPSLNSLGLIFSNLLLIMFKCLGKNNQSRVQGRTAGCGMAFSP